MKMIIYWAMLLVLVALQTTIGASLGIGFFAVPLCAILLIVLSNSVNTEYLLYMALAAGVLLDMASGASFGLNILFLLFVALFCKLVIRFGQREQGVMVVILLSGLITILYNFLQFVIVFSADRAGGIGGDIFRIITQSLYAAIWAAGLFLAASAIEQVKFNYKTPKLRLRRRS